VSELMSDFRDLLPNMVGSLDGLILSLGAVPPPCQAVVRHPGAPGSTVEGGDRRQFRE